MAHSYKFSVIQARPDSMRGERVNVGVVALGPSGLDVRLPEIRKLLHLTGHKWEEIASAYRLMLSKSEIADLEELHKPSPSSRNFTASEVFALGKPGEIRANTAEEYEATLRKVLGVFVDKPTLTRKEKQQKINTEIAAMLKKGGVLADKGQTIDDRKVIPKFVISEEKDIVADFAYKTNGLKVVSTLELRGLSASAHSKACEKGATLYFAKEQFGKDVRPLGVYAVAPAEANNFRSEIEILTSFADGNAFNWMDAKDRMKFKAALY